MVYLETPYLLPNAEGCKLVKRKKTPNLGIRRLTMPSFVNHKSLNLRRFWRMTTQQIKQ